MSSGEEWKTQVFRENIVQKINDKILATCSNLNVDAVQAENRIFQKAMSREQYFAFIAKFILYVKEKNKNPHSSTNDVDFAKEFIGQVQGGKLSVVGSSQSKCQSDSSAKRPEPPSDQQKLQIHRTAIASVIHSQHWQNADHQHISRDLVQFGQYVSTKLSQIESEEVLLSIQQRILSLLN